MTSNNLNNKISFTTDNVEAIQNSELIIVSVGTPTKSNGEIDLSQIENVTSNLLSNINGYNIDIRSTTRDYIGFGSYLSKGFPFSNWSFRVGGLEKISFIKPYVSSMSLEHSFSGKQNLSWKFNEQGIMPINLFNISSFENGNDDYLQFSRISRSFSPLIGISTTFNNGISTLF